MRNLEGLPTRIKMDTAERMNEALKALEIDLSWIGGNAAKTPVTQTHNSLTIGGVKLQGVRSYTTTRSIDFDSKVTSEVRRLINSSGYDLEAHNDKIDLIDKTLQTIAPKYPLSDMGNSVTTESLNKFLAQAKAVEEYTSQPWVRQTLAHKDAFKVLFSRQYSEVIQP